MNSNKKLHAIAKKHGYKSNEAFYKDYPTKEAYEMQFGGTLASRQPTKLTGKDGKMTIAADGFIGPPEYNPNDYGTPQVFNTPITGDAPPGAGQATTLKGNPGQKDLWTPTRAAPSVGMDQPTSETTTTVSDGFFKKHPFHGHLNTSSFLAGGLSLAAGLLPDQPMMDNQNHSQMQYNPRGYGDATQAIAAQGMQIDPSYGPQNAQVLGPGNIQPMGANSYSSPMQETLGRSHKLGGVDSVINGTAVNFQGGEGYQEYPDGASVIFGDTKMPDLGPESKGLVGKSFKSIAKGYGKQEEWNKKKLLDPSQDTDGLDPNNRFDSLALLSKDIKAKAFDMRSKAITEDKNKLREIQSIVHQTADDQGVDYDKAHKIFSKDGSIIPKKAKRGALIKANDGYDDAARFDQHSLPNDYQMTFNHNTGQMEASLPEYAQSNSRQGNYRFDQNPVGPDAAPSQFPYAQSMRGDMQIDPLPISGPKMYGDPMNQLDLAGLKQMPASPEAYNPQQVALPNQPSFGTNKVKHTSLADGNRVHLSDIASELGYLGKQPGQVLSQEYKPYLDSQYQVSFQDRRNQNQASYNEMARQMQGFASAASLGALAGQKYEADNQVNADEFRTNQGIFNQVTNGNYTALNEANRFNAQAKDQQFVRQATAKSTTDAQRSQALASISNKLAAKRYENMNIKLTEQRSGFRMNKSTGEMEWQGGPAAYDYSGSGYAAANAKNPAETVTEDYDPSTGKYVPKSRTRKLTSADTTPLATTKFGGIFKNR